MASRQTNTNSTSTIGDLHIKDERTDNLGKLDDDHVISTTWTLSNDSTNKLQNQLNDILAFCKDNNLNVEQKAGHLKVLGKAADYSKALQIEINRFSKDGSIYHANLNKPQIPSQLSGVIDNILGLNTKKIAKPHYHKLSATQNTNLSSFTPLQVAAMYAFPTNLNGSGQKIGIIELGGGYVLSDITHYFSTLGISGSPNITAVSVDGTSNDPSDTSGANIEVILDIEVIAALVPSAAIRVYFAPNTDQGFYDAIHNAITDGCNIISISWGSDEANWGSSAMSSYNTLFASGPTNNVTILAASGDSGSSDGGSGNNVDFPASSPYVLACGGTTLDSTNGTSIGSEVVWSGSGGGLSSYFTKPSYQNNVSYALGTHRGSPDVCGDADPNTGYLLYSASEGGSLVVGGTSGVAPLWSALLGRINQSIGHAVGFVHPSIYGDPSVCRDIISGSNGTYSAGVGWDPCSGNGSPNGQALLTLLSGSVTPPVTPVKPVAAFSANLTSGTSPLAVVFTDQSTNSPTSWSWSFGDSTTSTAQNPSHTYANSGTYTVSLTATNSAGSNTLTKTNYITVTTSVAKPVVAFIGSPTSGTSPLTVAFTDQSTNTPTSWAWNFGDSTTSTTKNPSHTYANAGTYTVSLTAGNAGGSNTLTKSNYIVVSQPVVKPVAAFVGSPTSGTSPLIVAFTDESTNTPTSWSWNFGDSTTSTSKNPSHTYANPGTYTVTLTATNSAGSNALTKSNYITVRAGSAKVTTNFVATPLTGTAPLTVRFTDESAGSPTSWIWNFGDGQLSTLQNPTHIYISPGVFAVSLIASNSAGSTVLTRSNYITVSGNIRRILP